MGDEVNDNSNVTGEFRRKRPVPIPIFNDRFIERPYQRKDELSFIRDAVEELVDIKKQKNVIANESVVMETKSVETKPVEIKLMETKKDNDIKIPEIKITDAKVPEIKVSEVKIGIGNLVDKKIVVENKSKNKKVIRMNDEDQYNVSPEMRRQIRKSEMEDYHNEKEVQEAVKKAASLAEQNRKDLEDMKKSLAAENAEIRRDLKNEFGNKFSELSGKFENVNGKFENVNSKFDGVSKKLEETCTGIDCLKKDLANINKNMDLVECPECGKKVVPPLSSYCPNCNAKMYSWTEDDGVTPVKGWKPSWKEK